MRVVSVVLTVLTYLENNNLLEINQGGFRKKHSTMDTIAKFTNAIFDVINNREITTAVFIDLAKAFDTVNYEILLKKQKYTGIKGNLLKLALDITFRIPFKFC